MKNTHTHAHTHTHMCMSTKSIKITIAQCLGCTIMLTHTALGIYVKRIDAATGVYLKGSLLDI